ncbi:hypothetical protein SI65_07788 [Aspergillus cristatus]|uniref:Uncharacterized protein n=1 Tax=Aspergillus cristatus TaxID=573508 RepID=A0A1E3B789_ASPCR|nr:hypothetical protein SI65_07788 [Aspergillus cristatus]
MPAGNEYNEGLYCTPLTTPKSVSLIIFPTMVLGIVMMSAMLPTMIGLNEATSGTRDREESRRDSSRKQRCHLVATCNINEGNQRQREQVHNAKVYVRSDGKLYITKHPKSSMAPFNGGFYTHPAFPPDNTSGMVTVTGENPPTLRWGHICGPFDWTKDEQRVTLDGWEGWLAVRFPDDEQQEELEAQLDVDDGRGIWRLYFDQHDDGAGLPSGAQGLEICLKRVIAES